MGFSRASVDGIIRHGVLLAFGAGAPADAFRVLGNGCEKQVRSFCLTLFDNMVFFQEIYRKVVAMGGKRRTGYSTELPGANVYTVRVRSSMR